MKKKSKKNSTITGKQKQKLQCETVNNRSEELIKTDVRTGNKRDSTTTKLLRAKKDIKL